QHHDALGLLMTHEGEYIRAAICLPQRLPVYKAGEGHILRRLFHGLPDLLGDQMGIRPAEPEETGLRHPPGQLQKFRQPLPGNGVTHGNHRPLPFPEAPAAAEGRPPGGIRREELCIHAVGNAVHRRLEAVALQQTAGVFRGGQHHVAQAVAEGDPLAEEGCQPVRAS
ncbi:PcfB family protein, partial [Dysosmobacter welbionis]